MSLIVIPLKCHWYLREKAKFIVMCFSSKSLFGKVVINGKLALNQLV